MASVRPNWIHPLVTISVKSKAVDSELEFFNFISNAFHFVCYFFIFFLNWNFHFFYFSLFLGTLSHQIQFCMAFLHNAQLLYTDCGYPRWSVCFTMPNAIFFYFLFNNFYKKTFDHEGIKSGKAKQKALNDSNNNDSNNNENSKNKDLNKKQS